MRRALKAGAYAVDCAQNAEEAAYRISINEYDLIILEIQLPDRDGVELCEEVRGGENNTPLLILTERGSVDDKIRGLDAGADDYLVKPFDLGELLARIRALLRRPRGGRVFPVAAVGGVVLDQKSRRILANDVEITLTNKEYALLEYFIRNADRVIGREEISEHVWDENFDPFSNLIEVYINRVRKKLSEHVSSPTLKTRRGSGYILELFADQVVK
jgi:two-component system copper resistance phosphate regulon response regulator CusR